MRSLAGRGLAHPDLLIAPVTLRLDPTSDREPMRAWRLGRALAGPGERLVGGRPVE
jgi:hypothetical protein